MSASRPPSRWSRRVSFTAHQVAEYAVGLALLAVGLHLSAAGQLLSIATGGALVVLNLVTAARLGTFKLMSRVMHHVADLVLAGALLVAAVVRFGVLRAPAAALAVGLALLLLWFERLTHYRDVRGPAAVQQRRQEPSRPIAAGPRVPAATSATALARRGARTAGLVVGITRRVVRERPKSQPGPAGSRARNDRP